MVNASSLTMIAPPAGTSATLVRSAAGFIATSTSGESPGVWMSDEEKLIWNPETPGNEPAGARISAGKSGSVAMSLPNTAACPGELCSGELHAVARVAGKADGDALQLLDGEGVVLLSLCGHAGAGSCFTTSPTTPLVAVSPV